MLHTLKKYIYDRHAAVMPIFAISLPAIMGIIALGVDGSMYMKERSKLQSAADAAALAAAWERAHDSSRTYAEKTALREARKNGFNESNGNLEINFETEDDDKFLDISLTQKKKLYFATFLSDEPTKIQVNTRAIVTQKSEGPFCLVSLNKSDDEAILTRGNGKLESPNCGMAVNSGSDTGLQLKGNVDIDLDSIRLAGGYDIQGGSAEFNYKTLKTDQSPLADPYKNIDPPPPPDTCSKKETNKPTVIKKDTVLSPGTYCGGITVKGNADVTLEDGNYYLYGGELDMSSNNSKLSSINASIILTGDNKTGYSQLDITGGQLDLEAPSESFSMAGMAIYQDPDAAKTKKHHANKIAGNAEIAIDGVVYLPSQGISFRGNSGISNSDACTRIVANKIELGGTPALYSNCEDSPGPSFTTPYARLIN